MPFPGGVQGGVPPFIDARPIDNPDKLAGKDSIERERGSSFQFPIEQMGLRFNEEKKKKRERVNNCKFEKRIRINNDCRD